VAEDVLSFEILINVTACLILNIVLCFSVLVALFWTQLYLILT